MAILNYTTGIQVEKTAAEIQAKLGRAGAQAVMCEYENEIVTHISFRIKTTHGLINFRLPANADGVLRAMQKAKLSASKCTKEQAQRVAWRIVKDWVEAQLAIIEAEMATLTEVFLPYAQQPNGKTVYNNLLEGGFPSLTHE